MIFVTVGTHEQPFDRLVECMDKLAAEGMITEDVIIQTGYSTYEPKHCRWGRLFPYSEMRRNVAEARIVVTHGGPSSFIMPLQVGKVPIVVPRQKRFGEHVNDHQMEFCRAVEERMGNIIVVEEIAELGDIISGYRDRAGSMRAEALSGNKRFNMEFERIVGEMHF